MKKPALDDVLKELARRESRQFKIEDYLFDKQLKFVLDPAPFKLAVTTRRAGKSVSCAADLTNECINSPDVVCLYITLSRKNAKRLIWPWFKKLNREYNLGGVTNESDLSITYPNGSILYILGASDRQSIEDVRGLSIKKAYLDESQSFPEYIKELVDEVIGPALMDHAGTLVLIGTPGPIPTGYFYELTKNKEWSQHKWSFFDNYKLPFLKRGITHQDILDRELKRRGVSTDDPSIRREWFAEWSLDVDSLVYRYNTAVNAFKDVPKLAWNYILGVDMGYDDADALAVLAWHESTPDTYVMEEIITRGQDITELVQQIESLRKRYDISKIVVDTGGLGKKITEEISRRYKIAVQPADKNRKFEYIELMNGALRTGTLKARPESRFAQDCMKVEWDHDKSTPSRKVVSSRFHSDICDAVLYAWRESYSYTHERAKDKPKYGTVEWQQAESERLEAEAEEHFLRLEEAAKDPYSG